jgi:methylglutaconyl-CoA hydratase
VTGDPSNPPILGADVTETAPHDLPVVHYGVSAGVATVTMDSPHNRNALSLALMGGVLDALRQALADDTVRVVVLTHTGTVFCSGADLKETQSGSGPGDIPVASLPAILRAIWESPKPVVARIAGPARAGGLGLIGACDLAVTHHDATFAFTEVRLGVIPAVISATVLPRLAPRAAAELFLTGAVFDGRRAEEVGLVTRAVAPEALDDEVDRYVELLTRGGPHALAGTKQLLRRTPAPDLGTELEQLTGMSVRYFTSDEGREGVASFREKRNAAWVPARAGS